MVSGPYKLMQQVVISLFTPYGGVAMFRQRGTDLAATVIRSGIQNEATMRSVFASSREQLLSEFAERQSRAPTLPADERLSDLVLKSLSIEGDALNLELEIRTAANQLLSIQLPIKYND